MLPFVSAVFLEKVNRSLLVHHFNLYKFTLWTPSQYCVVPRYCVDLRWIAHLRNQSGFFSSDIVHIRRRAVGPALVDSTSNDYDILSIIPCGHTRYGYCVDIDNWIGGRGATITCRLRKMEIDLKMFVRSVVLLSLATRVHLAKLCKAPAKCPDSHGTGFNIAVLLPEYPLPRISPAFPYYMQMVSPGIEIAAKRFPEMLPNSTVTLMYRNTECDLAVALNVALVDWLDRGADVFIGPACEYTTSQVSRFLGYRNVPMVTGGAMASGFRLDKDHPTITRTQAPYQKMGEAVRDFFLQHNWNHTIMMYKREENQIKDCYFAMGSIYRVLLDESFQTIHGDFDEATHTSRDYLNMLEENVMPKARSKLSLSLQLWFTLRINSVYGYAPTSILTITQFGAKMMTKIWYWARICRLQHDYITHTDYKPRLCSSKFDLRPPNYTA